MGHIVWVLFHFSQDVSHNLPIFILSNLRKLGPREAMIEIVLHLVVLRQAEKVAVLHVRQVFGPSIADVHRGGGGARGSLWVVNACTRRPLRSRERTIGAWTGARILGRRRKRRTAPTCLQRKYPAIGPASELHNQ